MGRSVEWARGIAWALCALVAGQVLAEGVPQTTKNWAWDKVKSWTYYSTDAKGQRIWQSRKFFDLSYTEQTQGLLEHLQGGEGERRAALLVLSDRPFDQWAKAALKKSGHRDEVALFLHDRGYVEPGKDPFLYLEPSKRLDRPWTHGLGMHLDAGGKWHFQWIPAPALMPKLDAPVLLPKALEAAPQPSALLHLKQLRPGLERLQALAGGQGGVISTLADGTRAGFYLRHVEAWLKQASVALEPLATREAWVLHYGLPRQSQNLSEGTLVYLPGDLPTRTKLMLDLLKLNPTSAGARSHTVTWKDAYNGSFQITQVRGGGGVLHLYSTPEGTWISDREAPLRALFAPPAQATLGERPEWCKVALAGMKAGTEASLWIVPRLGGDAGFERAALRRRLLGIQEQTWNNPFIAKAAPRGGDISLALGAGPTSDLIQSLVRVDDAEAIAEPSMPAFAEGGTNLSPAQMQAYQAELREVRQRNSGREAMRAQLKALVAMLDLRGASFYWNGWVAAPPLTAAQKASQVEFRKLQKEGPYSAARVQQQAQAAFYGGFGEPGMSPSAALTLPIQAAKLGAFENALTLLWPKLFRGKTENREISKDVILHRVRTQQAFTPCYAIVGGNVVLGSDDVAVQAVVAGLLGQGTSLADYQSKAFGVAEIDGATTARDLENLLLGYLRINHGGRYWWFDEPSPTDDEAAAEVASTFGPFLGAIKALGKVSLELEWTSGGLEAQAK